MPIVYRLLITATSKCSSCLRLRLFKDGDDNKKDNKKAKIVVKGNNMFL